MAKIIYSQKFESNIRAGQKFPFVLETEKKADNWRDRVTIDTRVGTLWKAKFDIIHIRVKNNEDNLKVRLWNGFRVSGKNLFCVFEPDKSETFVKCYLIYPPTAFFGWGWKDDHPSTYQSEKPQIRMPELDLGQTQSAAVEQHAIEGSISPRTLTAVNAAMEASEPEMEISEPEDDQD